MFDRFIDTTEAIYNKVESFIEVVKSNKIWYLLSWVLVVGISFAIILYLNILTPLISDDITYMFVYGETARITSVSDIIQSQVNHYYQWGGRSIVHFVAQLLLMLPAYVSDVLNASVYLIYVVLIYCHIKGRGAHKLSLFLLINLAVWFLQPVLGDTILWITGASNYLWGTTFVLLFLLPYRLYEGQDKSMIANLCLSFILFIWGVVAGWTNENTAGAMILIVFLFFLYYRSRKWKIPYWGVLGLVGSLAGFLIMILAPGNFERAGEAASLNLYVIAYRLFNCTFTFFLYGGRVILVALVVLILYNRFSVTSQYKREHLKVALIYYIAAVAAVYAMLLSPTFPRRALFGVITYLIVGMGILYYNQCFRDSLVRQMRFVVILVGLVCFSFTCYLAIGEIDHFRYIVDERETIIEHAKRSGVESCKFERFDGGTYIHGEDPYSAKVMSEYYGIKIELE